MKYVQALQSLITTQLRTKRIKAFPKDTFNAFCETGVFTVKFHVLDHVIEDSVYSRCLKLLSSSAHKQFTAHMKCAYRLTSQRRTSALEDTL